MVGSDLRSRCDRELVFKGRCGFRDEGFCLNLTYVMKKNKISVLEICIFVSSGNLDLQIDLMGSVAQHRFHWKNANHV